MAKTRERTPAAVSRVFGRQVKEARRRLGLKQGELAKRLEELGVDMHQVTIARVESGERRVSVDDALAIAAALGVNPLYLFSGDFTNEPVPVTPTLEVTPSQMRFWFEGNLPLPGTDERTYFELIPDEELIARQRRGLEHLKESVLHFVRAAGAKDRTEMRYALSLIGKELERQHEGLELEERRARKEESNG
ncbi:hypothetical protein BH20ACT14_BH20ACT14_01740 [soil metagenome]